MNRGRQANDRSRIKSKYEEELAELQQKCPHEETEILEHHYAPGHFGGMVKVCKSCEKVVSNKGFHG